jgi:hypothetical protein
MSREKLEQFTGCGLDVSRNHEEARALMRSLGYGPDGQLKVNVSVRGDGRQNLPLAEIRQLGTLPGDGRPDRPVG